MSQTKTNTSVKNKKSTSAKGPAAGYYFQIELLLHYLSTETSILNFYVEAEDDLFMEADESELDNILGQAKHSLKEGYCYEDTSIDLWKTLVNWLNLIEEGKIKLDKCKFHCISNRKAKNLSIIHLINTNETEKAIEAIHKHGKRSKNAKIKLYYSKIGSANPHYLEQLVKNIRLIVLEPQSATFKNTIKNALRIPNDVPITIIYDALLGWITSTLLTQWRNEKEGLITKSSFDKYLYNLVVEMAHKPFYEKAHLYLIPQDEVLNSQKNTFVSQLELIKLDSEDILREIDFFLRAQWEKTRFASDGDVPESEFDKLYISLTSRWKDISKAKIRLESKNYDNNEDLGYDIFYTTVKGFLARLYNHQTEQEYTTRGAYHHLANNREIGWHPDWEKHFPKL